MKKIIALIMIMLLVVVCLSGCTDDTNTDKSSNIDVYFWTDETTGVQYVIYSHSGGYSGMGGITPRLASDGSLYTAE